LKTASFRKPRFQFQNRPSLQPQLPSAPF